MDRSIREGNKIVSWRQLMISKEKHRSKIQSVSKVVDNSTPFSFNNPVNRSSKEFRIEGKANLLLSHTFFSFLERCSQIEKRNRQLLSKMQSTTSTYFMPTGPQGASSVRNSKSMMSVPSIARTRREKSQDKITQENIALLKKLQAQKSNYNVVGWEQERKETERLARNLQQHRSPQRAAKTSKAHHRRSIQTSQGVPDSNREMYELYQKSVKEAALSTRGGAAIDEVNHTAASNGSLDNFEQP